MTTITDADREAAAQYFEAIDGPRTPRASNARLGRMDHLQTVQAFARHREAALEDAVGYIPKDIIDQVLAMGRVEWGATEELTSKGHIAHLETSLRKTREHFNLADVPVAMHGLYLEGTETVLCHTGTSPNSPGNAQALTGAWNWLHDRCAAIRALKGNNDAG